MNLILPACEVWMCDVVKLSDKERESCESVCSAVTGCKKVWKHFESFQLPKETDVIAEFFSSKQNPSIDKMFFFFCCRLFETLQSLFWSIFGLISLYVTNVDADHQFTEFVGATMFGTYNIISLVVLLNMLIAMMNNSYQHIAVSTDQTYYRHDMWSGRCLCCAVRFIHPNLGCRITQTSSGSLPGQSCGWVTLKKAPLCRLRSTSSPAPNHSGTSFVGSRGRCARGGWAPSGLKLLDLSE